MYVAFGVKEKGASLRPAQGDVVVGWINAGTGRGGLDDYFLSGAEACEDGVESCPDTSKPGGKKNVEMLNSVSRENYTMITFKRYQVTRYTQMSESFKISFNCTQDLTSNCPPASNVCFVG